MSSSSSLNSESSETPVLASHGTLLEVRTGKTKAVFGPGIKSAIYKSPRQGRVKITKLGCEGDQQTFHEHGGPDKALLQYCSVHYSAWKTELPDSKEMFGPGGFGENLVADGVSEEDVCIGDVIRIGEEVLISVCEPRQPCYMLNHRFKVKDMSKRSQDSRRTGWYLRVLREGYVQAGDEMVLIERPNPRWSIKRVQHFLYKDMRNEDAIRELVQLDGLGKAVVDLFANRLRKKMEDQEHRLKGGEEEFKGIWSDYTVVKRSYETPRILSVVFEAKAPVQEPKVAMPGSHIRVKLGGDLVRAYSVVTGDQNCFELGIALSGTSRGGSEYIHKTLKIGDVLPISEITTSFPLHEEADRHIFIAGGIGLTAFIAAAKECEAMCWPYHLHYLVRTSKDVAFLRYLGSLGNKVTIHDKSIGKACDLAAILRKTDSLSHVYCCGSQRLIDAVKQEAIVCGLNEENVHFEAFEVDASGDPFTVCLQKSNKIIQVESRQTLLDVLRDAGLEVSSSCEVGNCGTCRVEVVEGRIDHRGSGLMDWEKGTAMLSCVSRGIGKIIVDI
jgi:MOSC domain-containing protein YiiM/ferredoxin-NADP reductase